MIRAELHDSRCRGCGASLDRAVFIERANVTYIGGEFDGEPGVAVVARCSCGVATAVPFSVGSRRAA